MSEFSGFRRFRLVFRVDANREIGSGHAMRCIAIADEAHRMGAEVIFVGSDAATASYMKRNSKYECLVIGGEWRKLDQADARKLCELCQSWQANAVLVDSYGASLRFFDELKLRSERVVVSCIDDQYTLEKGSSAKITRKPLDCIIAYSYYAVPQQWNDCYSGMPSRLLIGPRYAPLRSRFAQNARVRNGEVARVLVTSGATSPHDALGRMIGGVMSALGCVDIDVVQGQLSEFDSRRFPDAHIKVHRNISDLSCLVTRADLAVSAGGSTLYELACNGLPTLACPVVDNQIRNALAYEEVCKGVSMEGIEWRSEDVAKKIRQFVTPSRMNLCSVTSMSVVDGFGASRIVEALLHVSDAKFDSVHNGGI